MTQHVKVTLTIEFLRQVAEQFGPDFLDRRPETLQTFGKDWTKIYPPAPSAVVMPRTTDEVSRFLKLCTQHRVPVVPSGGRTGLAGGAVAPWGEVVLSLTRMNKMMEIDLLGSTVRVQAGAVTEAVHAHCAPHGLTWPVDFASKGSSHVGGNIATNAGGVKVIRYGLTRNWVLGLQVITMNGDVLELNGALEKNNTGVDLRQLFIGSEGTLGVVTEATLKLTRLPGELDVFFFGVKSLSAVLRLFREARKAPFSMMAFEFLTQNCLEAVVEHRGMSRPLQESHNTYVLLEVERPDSDHAQEKLDQWLAGLFEQGLVDDGVLAQSPREKRDLWSLREGVAESLIARAPVYKNDIALPIAQLESFVPKMEKVFTQSAVPLEVYSFGHIGDGNLHVNTMKPPQMSQEDFLKQCEENDQDVFALVREHGGSISAEHGIGLLKRKALGFSRTPIEIDLMKRIKKCLDPDNLLNPGKIFEL